MDARNKTINDSRLGLAIIYIILACMAYAAMGIFIKKAIPSTPIQIIIFFRFLFLLIFMLPFVLAKNPGKTIKAKKPWLLIGRGIIGVLGLSLMCFAIRDIPLATAILLSSTEPLFIPFVFRIAKGTKIIPKLYIGIIVGLLGVILILHPSHGYFEFASLFALGAGLCRALTLCMLRVSTKLNSTKTNMFYFFMIGTALSFVYSLPYWHHPSHWLWGWMVGIAFASLLFQFGLTKAFSHAPARIIGPFNYLSVVFAVIADWYLWGQGISWLVGVGIVLTISGAALTAVLGREIL